jgi:hypothetical protein
MPYAPNLAQCNYTQANLYRFMQLHLEQNEALGQIIMVSKSCAKWLLLHHGTDMVRSTELAHWPSGTSKETPKVGSKAMGRPVKVEKDMTTEVTSRSRNHQRSDLDKINPNLKRFQIINHRRNYFR